MTTSNTITKTDLENIINAIFPATSEDMTQAQIDAFIASLQVNGGDFGTLKQANAIPSGSYWTSGSIKVYKRFGVGMLKLNGASISALSARTTIATVPSEFYPLQEVGSRIDGETTNFFLTSTGEVRVNSGSAGQKWGCITYLTAEL